MSSGKFVLEVKDPNVQRYGVLEDSPRFYYDDASSMPSERRESVLALVEKTRDRWRDNYSPFTSASFRIWDRENSAQERRLIAGPKEERT